MIDYVMDKVERCEPDEQMHLERDEWPVVAIHFYVAAKVLWQDMKKGYNFKFDAGVHLSKTRGLIHIPLPVIFISSYSLAFFSLNEVPLSSEGKLPIKLKRGTVFE